MSRTFEQSRQILDLSNRVTEISQLILHHDKLVDKHIRPACAMVIFATEKIRADIEQSAGHPWVSEIEIAGNTLVASSAAQQILEDADSEQEVLEKMREGMQNKATEQFLVTEARQVWVHLRLTVVAGKIRQNMKSMLELLDRADDDKTREFRGMNIFQSYEGHDSDKQFSDKMLAWGEAN